MIVDNHQYNSPLRPNQHRSGLSYYEKILFFLGSLFVVVGILTLLEFKFKIIAQFTSESNEVNENVLAAHDLVPYTQFQSNLRYVLNNSAEVLNGLTISGDIEADGSNLNLGEGEITASNVMYGITAGEGITITGGQNPIISLNVPLEPTTGVSSIEDLSGAIDLEAGGNISISKDGNKLTISGSSMSDTNTTYSAGIGLELNGTTFNVDFNGIGLQDTASSAASGASIIGVYTGGFTNITTTTPGASLQTVLETIDSELSIMGGGGITAVGNISSGNAFTSGTPGSNLFIADTGWIGLGSGAGRIMWSDDTTDEISVLGARLGVGLLNPSYELDVAGNIRAGTDIYIGSTALTSTGGASALGVDSSSIIYSSGSNIQQVLEDLDTAINNFGVGGSGVWLDGGSYAYLNPALTTYLGNNASGGSNKLNGAYFSDNSLLSLGTDNDFRMLFNGTNLILGDTSNTFLSIGDSGTTGNFDFNNGQFYIRGDGNVGIGTTNVTSKLSINGGNIKHTASNTPPIIGSYDSNGWATGIYVNGKYAYLADETEGLKIIDINNPVSPNLVGSSTTPGTAQDVQVVGRYAYVADGHSGMTIIDVSNPDTPFIVSVTDTPDIVHNLYISGKYAYLASYSAGLYIVDVSNPYSPVVVGSYDSSGTAHDVFVVGKYAYLADYAAGLRIINISDPTNPTLSGTVDTSGSVNAVYVSGRYAYISDGTGDFKVIDVADPTNPTQVSSLSLDGSGNGIFMTGKYVYFSSYDGIFIIDVSDPANPEVVGSNTSLFNPFNIYVAGKYAYVGDAGAGLVILDINGIETPAIYAGNIQGNDLKVTEDAEIVNNLYVGNGLNVGMGGALIGGNLSIGASYDLSIGNIRLGGTGGAGLIGVNTSGFGVSTAPTVQGQLAALNAAVSSMSSPWTDAGAFLMPAAGEYLGNMAVGSTGKLAGAYFADNSLLSFGTDNDFRMTFNGTNFLLGDTSNTFLSIGDSGTTGNFNFNNGQVYIRGDGNVGIGTTAPAYTLDVDGVARSTSLLTDALVLSSSAGNMLTAQGGFNAYTQFSGGVGTGGIDSITPAQRITSSGNLTNIGSIQAGEMLLTSGGTFGEAVNYTTAANARHVAIGEFNGDKHPDLVAVNYTASGSASVFINNGDGTFATRVDYATDFLPANVATGDVNGDGYTDIVTVNAAHSVSVLLNNGDGTFATRVNYAVGSTPYTLSLGDFDGDGKLDIATANQDADTVSILLNNGDGTFATKVDYGSADAPRAIGVGDANGDNKLDVFVTSNIDDVVSVLLNNGDGTFATKVDYTTDENPQGIAIGDINDDGAVDIATANNSGTISILLNNGDGTFDTKVDYGSSGAYRAISLGDINGDGKPDISTASYVDDFVSVLMNNGDGTFATSVEYDTGANPWGVALGDLNNDGKADMIVSNSQAQSISVYINETSTMFYAQASTGRIGIGTTAPQYSLDVTGNIRAGTDIYIGSIGLGGTGGAGLIGVNTSGFGVSTAPTVQGQLSALNAAISGLGSGPWTDVGSFLIPASGEYLGNIAVGGTGKLSGAYFADNSLISLGTDNDFRMLFNGTNFILGDTSNTFLSIGDSGATANFAFNVDDFYIRGDGNIGIGTTTPGQMLTIASNISSDTLHSGLFSTGGNLIGQNYGGAYFGRVGITENQWSVSDAGVTWIARGSSKSWLNVAMSSDGKYQTATSGTSLTPDRIYTSADYGVTWTARDSNRSWQGVAMSADGKIQTANAYNGQIYTSTDYGATWTARASTGEWSSVAMSSDGKYQTAGQANGRIYRSSDYGATWTITAPFGSFLSVAMSSDGKIQTAVAYSGQIYTSTDYGATWTARDSSRQWSDIAMTSDGKIQTAVVQDGQIYTSTDYGVTWTARDSNRTWLGVAMSSDGKIQTAVAYSGQIYTSTDYGATWTARDSNRSWAGVAMSSDGKIQTALGSVTNIYTSHATSLLAVGNIGIGVTSQSSKFAIGGLGSNTGTNLVIDSSGNVWRDSSSLRYKDDISALVGPFDKIYELDPVKYRFKGTDSYTIGYVAEDLHALGLTDLVIYDNEGRPDAIKYDRLSLYNLELLKEQKIDIDGISSVLSASETSFNAQDTRILGIQDELTEYKAELDSLQDQIDELFDIVHNSNKVATEEASVAKLTDRVSFLEQMLFGTEASDEASLSQFKVNTEEYPDGEVLGIEDGKLTVEDLTVTGKTNLYDLGVIGDMSVGQLVVRGREATVNSLALPLQIQSQATAEIQLMAGKVVIDTDGNLTVQEEITAKKYNIDTSNEEESSAGSVVIKKGEVEIEIETTSLTESSLIFTSPKKIAVPVATEVIGKNKFLLKLDKKLTEDLEVSWWIVN